MLINGKRMLLVNAIDGESADGDTSIGDFLDSFVDGAGKKEEETSGEKVNGQDPDEFEDNDDDGTAESDEDSTGEDDSEDDDSDGEDDESDDQQIDPRDKMLEQQQAMITQLMEKVEALSKGEKEDKEEETPPVDPFESQEFQSMAEAMNWDSDEMSAFKTFFNKYMSQNTQTVMQKLMETVPQKVTSTVTQQQKVQQARDKFYEDNPELANVKPYVAELAKGVAAELGEKATMESVLTEVGKRAYKALGLTKMKKKDSVRRKPAFAGTKGARQKKTEVDPKQKEIDAVIGIL